MQLSELNIYPVKSLKGIKLIQSEVEGRGLRFDRRWMLVDQARKFLTQRDHPKMATIEVELNETELHLSAGDSRISVGLRDHSDGLTNVRVWTSSVKAAFHEPRVDEWFSNVLGTECRLVAMTPASSRKVNPFYAVRRFKDEVSFADGYPFLLIGQGSLEDLNSKLDVPVPMDRFRPNFVVSGSEPFAEDTWKRVRIGSTVFHVVKPCGRCVITTIDQEKGERTGVEPLKTLSGYRLKRSNVMFGQNLIAETTGATIRVGDDVEVVEYKKSARAGASIA